MASAIRRPVRFMRSARGVALAGLALARRPPPVAAAIAARHQHAEREHAEKARYGHAHSVCYRPPDHQVPQLALLSYQSFGGCGVAGWGPAAPAGEAGSMPRAFQPAISQ